MNASKAPLERFPGIREVFESCYKQAQELIPMPISIYIDVTFHAITMEKIVAIVCDICRVQSSEFVVERGTREVSEATQLISYIANEWLGKKDREIAPYIKKDRTTARANIQKIKDLLSVKDDNTIEKLDAIEKKLFAK